MSGEVKFKDNFVQMWLKLIKTIKYKLIAKNNKPINFLALYEFTPIYIYYNIYINYISIDHHETKTKILRLNVPQLILKTTQN